MDTFQVFLLRASTVTSTRRARYVHEDFHRYVNGGVYSTLVGTVPISSVATSLMRRIRVYLPVCKCQVNADASLDVHRLWGIHGRAKFRAESGKNILSRLSL